MREEASAANLAGDVENPSWDVTKVARRITTDLEPGEALEAVREFCREEGWELQDEMPRGHAGTVVHHSLSAHQTVAPSAGSVRSAVSASANRSAKPAPSVSATKWVTISAKLEPLTDDARRRMGAWVLRDLYPRNIRRGGYLEVYHRYTFDATFRSVGDGDADGDADRDDDWSGDWSGDADGPRTAVETIFEEAIDPYGGGIPGKDEFCVSSAFREHDPFREVEEALRTTSAG